MSLRIPLYECQSLIEAHLLKGMLEQCEVDVQLQGESLVGGVGELPAAGLLVLWVSEQHLLLARTLITEYEQRESEEERGHFLA